MSDTISQFANEMVIEQSSRSQVLMLMGFFGYSGGGKTVTALMTAVGLAGKGAKVGIIDTEQRRSGLAADVVVDLARKHYGVAPEIVAIYLDPPFHPLKYFAAIRKLQEAECKAICVDSLTHSWSGEGGYLDLKEEALERMAGNDWAKREKCAMAAAARVKPQTHAKMVDAILHAKVPIILCFRGKEKTTMQKKEGKTVPTRDDFATPIHEENLIYEMLISGECVPNEQGEGGYCRFVGPGCKHTHPRLLEMLPKPNEQFHFAHAEAIAKWCSAPTSAPSPASAQANSTSPKTPLLTELRSLTEAIHGWKKGSPAGEWESAKVKLEAWLVTKGIMGDTVKLSDLSAERLTEVLAETRAELRGTQTGQLL